METATDKQPLFFNPFPARQERAPRAKLPALARLLKAACAAFVTSIAFASVTSVLGVLRAIGDLLSATRFTAGFERRPVLTIVLGSTGAAAVSMSNAAVLNFGPTATIGIRVAVLIVIAAIYRRFLPRVFSSPATLADIREQVRLCWLDHWAASHLRRTEDAIWIRFVVILSAVAIPVVLGALLSKRFGLITMLLYGAVIVISTNTMNAFEHANAHYDFFQPRAGRSPLSQFRLKCAAAYIDYVFPVICARTPHWYRIQHVAVHHAEDNGPDDTQSTLRYDRASFIDFARCANKFALSGLFAIDIIAYLLRRRRRRSLITLLTGLLIFYGAMTLLALVNWRFVVMIIAIKYAAFLMTALGFFQEHGMVDTTQPQNIYRNSLHFVTPYNEHGSLGDDVHIEHHMHPGTHWTRYVLDARRNEERYTAEVALKFRDGPGHLRRYYRLLWCRDFVALAPLFAMFGRPDASVEERAKMLRNRTRPLAPVPRSAFVERLDCALGRVAGHLIPEV